MREIKFKAYIKKKEKIYEVAYTNKTLESVIYETSEENDDGWPRSSHLDDIELMQYTGFKDNNEVDIYEDDIIEHLDGEYSFIGIVQYSPFGWFVKTDEDNIPFEYFADDTSWIADCKVIGNAYTIDEKEYDDYCLKMIKDIDIWNSFTPYKGINLVKRREE